MLFYAFYPVNLASYSSALTPYETSCINQYHLASFIGLGSLASQVLDAFHTWPSQSLLLLDSGIWTHRLFLRREPFYQMNYIKPTAMCWLSCCIKFCSTQYNTPRTFCLANYSVVFCDLCWPRLSTASTDHSNCIQALGCNPSDQYTTLSHAN